METVDLSDPMKVAKAAVHIGNYLMDELDRDLIDCYAAARAATIAILLCGTEGDKEAVAKYLRETLENDIERMKKGAFDMFIQVVN